MKLNRITEQPSRYRHLEEMSVAEITTHINDEDKLVPLAIEKALPAINKLIQAIVIKLRSGGRMFYLGSGSGGRLSVLDAIELPTTFGISRGMINVILAGGLERLVEAPEEMEDDINAGWEMLLSEGISEKDIVIGISASGNTPFVLAAIKACHDHQITSGCIVSNLDSPIAAEADFPVEVITGPEFLTGSTRMKCGSAQKMICDMISTTTMIQLGRVKDNRMVNMRILNKKMTDRAVRMLMDDSDIKDYDKAKELLLEYGSVTRALETLVKNNTR